MLDLNLNLNLGLASVFGDPTALTQNNADALFTALGLTQAGTGTTWGETGNDEIPLYSVDAAKVPLAVEEINGKNYFGPIINPAGTNLALYNAAATKTPWVKTNCTAALALGGLEHGSEWRGADIADGWLSSADGWTLATGWSYSDGALVATSVTGYSTASRTSVLSPGKAYLIDIEVVVNSGGVAVWLGASGPADAQAGGVYTVSGSYQILAVSYGTSFFFRGNGPGGVFDGAITSFSMVEVDAHTLITSSSDNATCLQSITSTSGERVTKWWMQTDDTDVFVSHGAPTGSALYEDDFSSDTSGEWARGFDSVDGTIAVSGGVLTHTAGAGDGTYPNYVREITGLTPGKLYRCVGTLGGTGTINFKFVPAASGSGTPQITGAGTRILYNQAPANGILYVGIQISNAVAGQTVTLDNISIYEVAETELTTGANPVPVDLDAATFANPQLGIRLANSGDSVRLYGVQHQVAARPLRPYIGPTTSSTVTTGARTLNKILPTDITDVSVDLVVQVPAFIAEQITIFELHNSVSYTPGLFLARNTSTTITVVPVGGAASGPASVNVPSGPIIAKLSVRANASLLTLALNDAAPLSGSGRLAASGITRLKIGTAWNLDRWSRGPILAFRDNIGNLLDGNRGWNHRLLDNWS